jgi:hypothetical protein
MLKNSVLKAGNWPISKSELVDKNLKQFIRCINSMDLEKLNHSKSCKWTLITDMYNYISMYRVILSVLDPRKSKYLKDYSLDFEHA